MSSGVIGGTPNIGGQVSSRAYIYNPGTMAWEASTGTVVDGNLSVNANVFNGFAISGYNYIGIAYDTTTDTYTYKSGGAGGTTIGVLVVTYTDSSKQNIQSVSRTV